MRGGGLKYCPLCGIAGSNLPPCPPSYLLWNRTSVKTYQYLFLGTSSSLDVWRCVLALLFYFIQALLFYFILALMFYFIQALLFYFMLALLFYFIQALSFYFIQALLFYFILALFFISYAEHTNFRGTGVRIMVRIDIPTAPHRSKSESFHFLKSERKKFNSHTFYLFLHIRYYPSICKLDHDLEKVKRIRLNR